MSGRPSTACLACADAPRYPLSSGSFAPAASHGRLRQGKPGSGCPMPLASPPDRPHVVYGFGHIDASGWSRTGRHGRLADEQITMP